MLAVRVATEDGMSPATYSLAHDPARSSWFWALWSGSLRSTPHGVPRVETCDRFFHSSWAFRKVAPAEVANPICASMLEIAWLVENAAAVKSQAENSR